MAWQTGKPSVLSWIDTHTTILLALPLDWVRSSSSNGLAQDTKPPRNTGKLSCFVGTTPSASPQDTNQLLHSSSLRTSLSNNTEGFLGRYSVFSQYQDSPSLAMAPPDLSHRRTHNLLLLSKLLNLRDNASPFTLILDSLEQPANILLKEYTRRANVCYCLLNVLHNSQLTNLQAARNPVIFVSFETLRCPPGVDTFVTARKKSPPLLLRDISQAIQGSKRVDGSPKSKSALRFLSL